MTTVAVLRKDHSLVGRDNTPVIKALRRFKGALPDPLARLKRDHPLDAYFAEELVSHSKGLLGVPAGDILEFAGILEEGDEAKSTRKEVLLMLLHTSKIFRQDDLHLSCFSVCRGGNQDRPRCAVGGSAVPPGYLLRPSSGAQTLPASSSATSCRGHQRCPAVPSLSGQVYIYLNVLCLYSYSLTAESYVPVFNKLCIAIH